MNDDKTIQLIAFRKGFDLKSAIEALKKEKNTKVSKNVWCFLFKAFYIICLSQLSVFEFLIEIFILN